MNNKMGRMGARLLQKNNINDPICMRTDSRESDASNEEVISTLLRAGGVSALAILSSS